MEFLSFIVPRIVIPSRNSLSCWNTNGGALTIGAPALFFPVSFRTVCLAEGHLRSAAVQRRYSRSDPESDSQDGLERVTVEALRVPDHWSQPSKAMEESEWLRVNLHKWLDNEYCPEETNVQISKVAAGSYYDSLVEKQSDLGEILLRMARDLESISYQESFHGAFSSANAAVNLIIGRMQQEVHN